MHLHAFAGFAFPTVLPPAVRRFFLGHTPPIGLYGHALETMAFRLKEYTRQDVDEANRLSVMEKSARQGILHRRKRPQTAGAARRRKQNCL